MRFLRMDTLKEPDDRENAQELAGTDEAPQFVTMSADGHNGKKKDDHEDTMLTWRHEKQHPIKERVNDQEEDVSADEPIIIVKEGEERLLMDFFRHLVSRPHKYREHSKTIKQGWNIKGQHAGPSWLFRSGVREKIIRKYRHE